MKKYLTKLFYSQKGAYTIMTALMMPAILLFMGLGIGVLALLNDKAELGDASEAAAFAMARENKGNDTSVNAAITQSVYQFYFPHLTNIGSNTGSPHQFQVGFHRVGGGTPPSPHIEKHPSQHYSCQVTPSYTSGAANYYRASGRDFEFNSFAGHLIGSLGFESLEKVVNTGLAKNGGAVFPGSRTCACDAGYTRQGGTDQAPICKKKPNPNVGVSIAFEIVDSAFGSNQASFDFMKGAIRQLAEKIHNELKGPANGLVNFQVLYTGSAAGWFSNYAGQSYNFWLNPTMIDKNNSYLDKSIFTDAGAGHEPMATEVLNILDKTEYDKFQNQSKLIKFQPAETYIAAAYLYLTQQLYGLYSKNRGTPNNIVILLYNGYMSNMAGFDPSVFHCTGIYNGKCYYLQMLDKARFCEKINAKFKKFGGAFTPELFLVPGPHGTKYFPENSFMPNCFPRSQRFLNPNLNTSNITRFVDTMYADIKKMLKNPAHLFGRKSAHTTAGKRSHSSFAVSTSSPQLIYRWSQSEVPLPN